MREFGLRAICRTLRVPTYKAEIRRTMVAARRSVVADPDIYLLN